MEDWTQKLNELTREYVLINILNNDYYDSLREEYDKDHSTVDAIVGLYEGYGDYSIYKIMDSIEIFLRHNCDMNIWEAVNSDDFYIED